MLGADVPGKTLRELGELAGGMQIGDGDDSGSALGQAAENRCALSRV
jgi:hypothetical protein